MKQEDYHHANILAAQLREDLANQNTEMLATFQNIVNVPEPKMPIEPTAQPAANVTIKDNLQL